MRTTMLLLVLLLMIGCTGDDPDRRADFPDVLDHRGAPAAADDWTPAPFADQGAWFGFTLPDVAPGDPASGFGGPFLMAAGRWLSPGIARLDLDGAEAVGVASYPGLLALRSRAGDLDVRQTLWFDASSTALIRARIRNDGDVPTTVDPTWTGEIFADEAVLAPAADGVAARTRHGSRVLVTANRAAAPEVDGSRYRLSPVTTTVAPGDSLVLLLAVSLEMDGAVVPDPAAALSNADASLARNADRWRGYLDAVRLDADMGIVAVKSIQTLVDNWRAPADRMRHAGLFPSSNVWYFNGFWAWDSWKHAAGLVIFEPDVAADQLRLMFDHQDDLGMIADVVYLDPDEDNWRDTKPPLAGWALQTVYERSGDLDLVRDLYPKLVAYHAFWYEHRDHDRDGLCEYGSTDGTLEAARWESGMDNAVRFDDAAMLENGPRAWSMDRASVDLNSYLYREKLALGALADALGEADEATRWRDEAATLGALIRDAMYDEETGWFYDVRLGTGDIVPVQGPEGWIPLWAGVATAEQAARVRATMLDPKAFGTHVPFPTVARNHPGFSDGYWRGLVWIDQAHFAVAGLRAYGYHDDADELTRRILANLEGAATPGAPLRENYHPLTGEGRNVRHFSWTAAHLLMMTEELR